MPDRFERYTASVRLHLRVPRVSTAHRLRAHTTHYPRFGVARLPTDHARPGGCRGARYCLPFPRTVLGTGPLGCLPDWFGRPRLLPTPSVGPLPGAAALIHRTTRDLPAVVATRPPRRIPPHAGCDFLHSVPGGSWIATSPTGWMRHYAPHCRLPTATSFARLLLRPRASAFNPIASTAIFRISFWDIFWWFDSGPG